MLAWGGLLILVGSAVAVLTRKVPVYAAYTLIPLCVGLLFGVEPAALFSHSATGVLQFLNTAGTILLSACFFCGMAEAGLYDHAIACLLRGRTLSPTGLILLTGLCSLVIIVGGSITACYLVILPAFLPLYDAAGIDRLTLLTVTSAVGALGLLLPWSSKTLLLSGLSGITPESLFLRALPLLLFGAVVCLLVCLWYGRRAHRKGAQPLVPQHLSFPERPYARPKNFAVNCVLFVICVAMLMAQLPAMVVLILMLTLFLLINYHSGREEAAVLRTATKNVIPIILTVLSIGVMLGILEGSGMTDAMTAALMSVIPPSLARYAPLLVMALFTPTLPFLHYHSLYALTPLLLALLPDSPAAMVVLPFVVLYPTCCSPMTGLTHLACRICEEEPLRFARFAMGPLCTLSYASLLFGALAGLFF